MATLQAESLRVAVSVKEKPLGQAENKRGALSVALTEPKPPLGIGPVQPSRPAVKGQPAPSLTTSEAIVKFTVTVVNGGVVY